MACLLVCYTFYLMALLLVLINYVIFSYNKKINYDSILLIVKRGHFLSDHLMHGAECISNVLILRCAFIIDVILSMCAYTGSTKSNHTGF